MKQKWVGIAGICLVLGLSCGGNKEEFQSIVRPVHIVKVVPLGAMQRIYTGVVSAEEYGKLAFKVAGPLVEMNVDAGQKVRKGTVIAAVDPLDYRLRHDADKAAYITAKSQRERNRRLLAMQAISKQEYEMAEAAFAQAQAAYETSADMLANTRLKAPFDGFVEEKYVENYQKVQPGEPVVKLVNPDKLEVHFIFPETNVRLIREAMQVAVEFDTYKGKWFKAEVKAFVDASPGGSGIPVRLAIADTAFNREMYAVYPGFSCKVKLCMTHHTGDGYSVPLSAVFKDVGTNETSVWLYDTTEETVKRQPVVTEQLFGADRVQITSGLKADDIIVVAGANFITQGQKVSVLNN
ncbi:MAG: efflux RND transporter periplasmic adaptor subunit [Odoribacter sp.]|nr:efflux RND transporter periplasmic adaptor subunit [Odoribacter sp.]